MSDASSKKWGNEWQRLREGRDRYLESLDAIRELADFATEHVVKLDEKTPIEIRVRVAARKADDSVNGFSIKGFYEYLPRFIERESPGKKVTTDRNETFRDDQAPDSDNFEKREDRRNSAQEMAALIERALKEYRSTLPGGPLDPPRPDSVTIDESRTRTELLLSSLLIAAISDFEVLFSAMARFFFRMRPEALRSSDSKIAWSEIEAYESLEDVRSHFVDERINQLMWGGFDEWMKWLSSQMKIKFQDVALEADQTIEIFQRRHILVHNGGLVSAQYLSKVGQASKNLAVGTAMPVNIDYLNSALDRLAVLGGSLTYSVMRKLCSDESQHTIVTSDINDLIYAMLKQHRWVVVEALSDMAIPEVEHEAIRCVIRINGWIAQKRIYGKEVIASRVSKWDVSALQKKFLLAKKILLDDPSVIDLAEELLVSGELDQEAVDEWPLLEDLKDEINGRMATSEEPTTSEEFPTPEQS